MGIDLPLPADWAIWDLVRHWGLTVRPAEKVALLLALTVYCAFQADKWGSRLSITVVTLSYFLIGVFQIYPPLQGSIVTSTGRLLVGGKVDRLTGGSILDPVKGYVESVSANHGGCLQSTELNEKGEYYFPCRVAFALFPFYAGGLFQWNHVAIEHPFSAFQGRLEWQKKDDWSFRRDFVVLDEISYIQSLLCHQKEATKHLSPQEIQSLNGRISKDIELSKLYRLNESFCEELDGLYQRCTGKRQGSINIEEITTRCK